MQCRPGARAGKVSIRITHNGGPKGGPGGGIESRQSNMYAGRKEGKNNYQSIFFEKRIDSPDCAFACHLPIRLSDLVFSAFSRSKTS